MKFFYLGLLAICAALGAAPAHSQSLVLSKEFRLGSPFSEPDGRNDVVKINETDFATLAKVKGKQTGASDFLLERYNGQLNPVWQIPLSVEVYEDYKDLYFNGKELIILSVMHQVDEKRTKLEAYAFDPSNGKKLWTKELESFQVGDWETHPHKGRVKENFIDLVCEHTSQDFITPFEYKHNIHFSPDNSMFVSYVYNYGEKNLTASVSIYDHSCNLVKRGKVAIDNDYTNYGFYCNNAGDLFILNANNYGKLNLIRYDLETEDFSILDLPSSNFQKEDFHVKFLDNETVYVGNSEVKEGKIMGAMISRFNFRDNQVDFSVYEEFDEAFRKKLAEERRKNKQMKGDEDWLDYDLTHLIVNSKEEVFMAFEKRVLHADGYPHIGRQTFDKSHKVEFSGHIQAEAIILLSFDKEAKLKWKNFILKNQVYPANDGLNTVSFMLDDSNDSEYRILFASSENLDASLHSINLISVNPTSGTVAKSAFLPNEEKLTLVREYTLFLPGNQLVVVGKKGMLGKSSMIMKYKL